MVMVVLSRFEKARVLSARALQISMGAPVLVKVPNPRDAAELALRELEEGALPINVIRKMPGGKEQVIDIAEDGHG